MEKYYLINFDETLFYNNKVFFTIYQLILRKHLTFIYIKISLNIDPISNEFIVFFSQYFLPNYSPPNVYMYIFCVNISWNLVQYNFYNSLLLIYLLLFLFI